MTNPFHVTPLDDEPADEPAAKPTAGPAADAGAGATADATAAGTASETGTDASAAVPVAIAPPADTITAVPGRRTPDTVRVLAIVPAYNEAASIATVVGDLKKHMPHCDVVVVDDGSTDATSFHVPEQAILLRLPFNLGIGGAMQTGYRYAQLHGYDVAVQVDADGQHPPEQARKVVQALLDQQVDMAIGSRFMGDGDYQQSTSRMAGIRVLRGLLKVLTGKTFTDCTSGLRAANHRVIRAFANWYPDDYPEPEVVLLLHKSGFKLVDVPVRMEQRATGVSSISMWRGVFYVIKVSVSLLIDTIRQPWPELAMQKKDNATADLSGTPVQASPSQAIQDQVSQEEKTS